ncbi:MAG: DUF494 family protein [Candidatus Latescibacteria bacterium]|nr:DUF494 family protein [Candidatus Latescibacterota bacterium]
MWTRLMDLVMLVAEMSRSADRRPVELDKELTRRGYSSEEIEHAVFWISSRPEASRAFRPGRATRVLSEFERMSLSTEAYDYLFRLQNLGIIDGRQFETILARAIPVGAEKVHAEDVKGIACSVIFNRDMGDVDEEAFDRFDTDGAPV